MLYEKLIVRWLILEETRALNSERAHDLLEAEFKDIVVKHVFAPAYLIDIN